MMHKIILGPIKALLRIQSLRWSFASNVTGRLWLGVMNLVAIPIFIYLLGTEVYGLVGLVQTLQALLAILDFGLATTVNREVAVLRAPDNHRRVADLVRTFEWIYWTIALVVGVVIVGMAGWIAHSWVTTQTLSPSEIQMAVVLGGITLAARWPVALYTGVLRGLDRQVLQNGILIVAATARVGLTLAAMLLVSQTIYCFLITQALVNMMEALLIGYVARRLVDPNREGRFHWEVLRRVWRFAVSFNLVGTFGMLVSSANMLLISALLPLSALTYYSVCGTATGALQMVYLAAAVTLFPRMTQCWKHQDLPQLLRLYQLNLRMTIYLCLGPVMLLCFLPFEVLTAWTHSSEVATHACTILPVLAAAALANCTSTPSYNMMIAAGHTRIPLLVNIVSLPAMWIGCYLAIPAYGLIGAAACWLTFNLACVLVYGEYCRRKILQLNPFAFWREFPAKLILTAVIIGILSKAFLPHQSAATLTILWFAGSAILFYAVGMLLIKGEERRMVTMTFFPSH